MLDNKNYINQYDTQGALDLAAHSPEQLAHAFDVKVENPGQIDAVVFSAMGGSALQAEFARTWPKLQVPFIVSKDYSLPSFVNERTLVIVASYSGNTEETLSALAEAREKGATIAIMTGGGKLLEQATQHGDTHVVIPKAIQPRMAVFYAFRGLVELFVGYGLVDKSVLTELEQLVAPLEAEVAKWVKSVPTHDNPAKQLAEKMVDKIVSDIPYKEGDEVALLINGLGATPLMVGAGPVGPVCVTGSWLSGTFALSCGA